MECTTARGDRIEPLGEVVPAGELVPVAVQGHRDALALLAAADDSEVERVRRGGEELVVFAEADVVDRRALGERHPLELDRTADAAAARDVRGVRGEAVG